jgi:hypothetical protein
MVIFGPQALGRADPQRVTDRRERADRGRRQARER